MRRSIRPTRAALGVRRANIEAIVYRRSWKHLLSRRGGIGAEIGRWRTGTTGASETDHLPGLERLGASQEDRSADGLGLVQHTRSKSPGVGC